MIRAVAGGAETLEEVVAELLHLDENCESTDPEAQAQETQNAHEGRGVEAPAPISRVGLNLPLNRCLSVLFLWKKKGGMAAEDKRCGYQVLTVRCSPTAAWRP